MNENTNSVQRRRRPEGDIDDTDRKLLGLLSEDSSQSYAELGAKVHLSAPAVHERVKRLKASGVIRNYTITVDGSKIGRPFLAFIHVNLTGPGARDEFVELHQYEEVEEVHSVAGDSCLLLKVRCENAGGLENVLSRLRKFGDVTNTRSYVALTTFVERGPQAVLD